MSPITFKRPSRAALVQVVQGAQWAAGLFALVIAILLAATYIQTRLHDPLASPALVHLLEKLEKEPGNTALQEQVRSLDLLARKAYFTSQWQLRLGGILLLLGLAGFILFWKLATALIPPPLAPPSPADPSPWTGQKSSRRAMAGAGIGLAVFAILGGYLVQSELSSPAALSRSVG